MALSYTKAHRSEPALGSMNRSYRAPNHVPLKLSASRVTVVSSVQGGWLQGTESTGSTFVSGHDKTGHNTTGHFKTHIKFETWYFSVTYLS